MTDEELQGLRRSAIGSNPRADGSAHWPATPSQEGLSHSDVPGHSDTLVTFQLSLGNVRAFSRSPGAPRSISITACKRGIEHANRDYRLLVT
jgi:hypothetical protein